MQPKVLVKIFRALMDHVGEGGSLYDFGCAFGHVTLSAMMSGCFKSAYGCELPENVIQCDVFEKARIGLGLDQQVTDGPSQWVGSDVLNLRVPVHLRHLISAVFSFWNGWAPTAQSRVLYHCRVTFINVRAVAVFLAKGWTIKKGIVAAMHLLIQLHLKF